MNRILGRKEDYEKSPEQRYDDLVNKINDKIDELEVIKHKSPRVLTDIVEIQKMLQGLLEK